MAPSPQRILVLAPHPDDETFGCGGTLALLADAGAAVDVAFLTRGEAGTETALPERAAARAELAEIRMAEAHGACDVLGVGQRFFLDGRDGALSEQPSLAAALAGVLAGGYRRVFCPHPREAHPDHAAAYLWFRDAARAVGLASEVWLYEVWTPLEPNMHVPIDHVVERKAEAMRRHRSQTAQLDYVSAFQGLARYRALAAPPSEHVEAFHVCEARDLV